MKAKIIINLGKKPTQGQYQEARNTSRALSGRGRRFNIKGR